jgi:hypothetical protein
LKPCNESLKDKTRNDTKITFYKEMVAPMLRYGSESWALIRFERRKIETGEIHFIRRISVYTLTGHVCNTIIINALQIHAVEETSKTTETTGMFTS